MAECSCNTGVRIIYSCSGAADVGELADQAARRLRREGLAQGSCIAGVGAGLSGYVQSALGADMTIVVDGCPMACGKKILENIGAKPVAVTLAELGYKKGESPFSEELLSSVVCKINKILSDKIIPGPEDTSQQGGCSC